MTPSIRELIKQYLAEAKLMQLATVSGDQPWVCSVWFAADDDLNLYWFSSETRRHSEELEANNKVAGAIVMPHSPKGAAVRGIQFEGIGTVLTDDSSIEHARKYYEDRIFSAEQIDDLMNHPTKPHHFYRVQPTRYVLFDTLNFPDESRQEMELTQSG